MRKWMPLMTVLALVGVQARAADAERFLELRWIPEDAEAVLGFEEPGPGAGALLPRLRDELIFASRLDERLPRLSVAADSLRVRRLLAAVVPLPAGGHGAVALLHGAFSTAAAESALLPSGGSRRFSHGVPLRVAAAEGTGPEVALAFVDAHTVVYGERPALEVCLATRQARGRSLLTSGAVRPLLDEISSEGHAWGMLSSRWLYRPEAQSDPAFPYHGLGESLAGVRWATFAVPLSSRAVFRMRTRAASSEDAFVLADGLRAFLASYRLNPDGSPAVLEALERSRVSASGPTVTLVLDLSADALTRLRHNEASRALLSWRLGSDEREVLEKVGEILARLEIAPGDRVADVGSGLGFFSVALARRVGETGRVLAVDIDERVLGELKRRAAEGGFPQLEVVLGTPDDPRLSPDSLDAALIVNSYHEMPGHEEMLHQLHRALRPGGRLLLVEPFSPARRNEPRDTQEKAHLIAPELVEADLRGTGFEVLCRVDEFIRGSDPSQRQSLLLARRPPAP